MEQAEAIFVTNSGLSGLFRSISILDDQFPGPVGQAFRGAIGDDDAFRGFQAPIIHPLAGHKMEGHAWL